jgi:cyclopropane-fatty-acyl-phospholipid synthase
VTEPRRWHRFAKIRAKIRGQTTEDFGLHYARTLRLRHDNLRRSRHNLEALGYDQTFYRLWEFYLCYCEGGFLERSIGTARLLLAKPGARPQPFGLKA